MEGEEEGKEGKNSRKERGGTKKEVRRVTCQ